MNKFAKPAGWEKEVEEKVRPWPIPNCMPELESMVVRLAPMPLEKAISTSVAPAMMNQVLTSWLLTTSPRLSASSSAVW